MEKKAQDKESNADNRCQCPKCPLFTQCNKTRNEKMFCANGKSICDMDNRKMCLCPTGCVIYSENNQVGAYFCINETK